jgi:hypothetical protein
MHLFGNVTAFCRKDGQVVPGSERSGHNLITNYGQREWLSKLTGWLSFGDPTDPTVQDEPLTHARIRWIGLGTGWQPETRHAKFLDAPIAVEAGSVYLAEIDPATEVTNPVITSFKIEHEFDGSIFGPALISELGLYTGYKSGGLFYPVWQTGTRMDPESDTNPVSFYKILDPAISVGATDTLVVRWELRY